MATNYSKERGYFLQFCSICFIDSLHEELQNTTYRGALTEKFDKV